MLVNISLVLALAVAALLLVAATRPKRFRVERQATIQAAPDKVFGYVNDFHRWTAWSPWEKLDPDMNRSHAGPSSGPGASYAWEGNKKVGQGRMEVLESVAPKRLVIQLDFLKPFEAHNIAEFGFEAVGGATRVTWAMHGPSPFMMRLIGVFMSMDKMVGKDFEAGLANLKAAAEK